MLILKGYGLYPADILLPKNDLEKWAVIACDQFTSEPEYWKNVEKEIGDFPSSLKITLPEVYLGESCDARIENINKTMNDYLKSGLFDTYENAMIYTERKTSAGVRRGIVGLIDLEEYDYGKNSRSLIRATEKTVTERIPPRVKIRRDAAIELPHVLLLIDDKDDTVIAPLEKAKSGFEKIYGFELMQGGGHIDGYLIGEAEKESVFSSLEALADGDDKFLFAVGDGNHSLATAKECYKLSGSPLQRYALCEVVNIHDPALKFEPIYRIFKNAEPGKVINEFIASQGGEYYGEGAVEYVCVFGENEKRISVKPSGVLAVGTLQEFADRFIAENPSVTIDYIHGEDTVRSLAKSENSVGFIFDGIKKSELFEAVRKGGSLPRKTFSMGNAREKRYYLECRKIK